jgi:DNA-binding Lrp family transcriptional regulator
VYEIQFGSKWYGLYVQERGSLYESGDLEMGGNGSGRAAKEIDLDVALDLLMRGESIPVVSTELGISAPTLRKRIQEIQEKQGVLLQYRAIQSLQLTELQARVLEAITPEKIEQAPLRDLVMSYKILKDKEQTIEGKPSEIKGLVAHLIYMEKQESALKSGNPAPEEEAQDAEFSDEENESPASLATLDTQRF